MPIAKVNGINICYKIVGEGDPLVMIMGLGSNQNNWRFQIPSFKKFYRIITFDNRGAGNSDKPKGPYSIRQMADDTIGLMDHLGIMKAHVLGTSLGGMIAQEIAINYPERVLKLVLGCTFACQDEDNGGTPQWDKSMDEFINNHKIPSVKLACNTLLYRILGLFLLRMLYGSMEDKDRAGFIAQNEASQKHYTKDRLSLIIAPTLIIVGTGDKAILPGSSDTMAKLIPNAKIAKIQNGSHLLMIEHRGRFNKEVLDFLKNG